MSDQRRVVRELERAAECGEGVVLASVVRTVGSSYRGVGARMVVRADGTAVGMVSGGCLEADLVAQAKRVAEEGRAKLVTYDSLSGDDLVWGLGLGCNGIVDVLVEPLSPRRAGALAALLGGALDADAPVIVATVVQREGAESPAVGARVFVGDEGGVVESEGEWGGEGGWLWELVVADAAELAAREGRAETREYSLAASGGRVVVAFEVVTPSVRLVVCGSGADVVPVVRLAVGLGWAVTVVDHRPVAVANAERFPGAQVVECADSSGLASVVSLTPRTAVVVMSHHFARDVDYLDVLLDRELAYVGLLGPRSRTERMLGDLAARGRRVSDEVRSRLYGPIGLDVGGDGPEAIALAIVGEVSAVVRGRSGGHLRDRRGPIHESVAPPRAGVAD